MGTDEPRRIIRADTVAAATGLDPEAIAALRQRLGLTQSEMAERLGTTSVTIHRWEKGLRHPVGLYLQQLRRLAEQS